MERGKPKLLEVSPAEGKDPISIEVTEVIKPFYWKDLGLRPEVIKP